MGVLPHHFHTVMSLSKAWVANSSLTSNSAAYFATGTKGIMLGLSQNARLLLSALLVPNDMNDRQGSAMGVLPHPFHTVMCLRRPGLQIAAPCLPLSCMLCPWSQGPSVQSAQCNWSVATPIHTPYCNVSVKGLGCK